MKIILILFLICLGCDGFYRPCSINGEKGFVVKSDNTGADMTHCISCKKAKGKNE